jgi:hypothetical protein
VDDALLFHTREHPLGFAHGVGERHFAKDGLAREGGGDRDLGG